MPSPHPPTIRRKPVRSLFIEQGQSPGDIVMLTGAVRDIKAAYPEMRINVETTAMALWRFNPRLDPSLDRDGADAVVYARYPDVRHSNDGTYHFGHAFRHYLRDTLGLTVPQGKTVRGEVFVPDAEAEAFAPWLARHGLPPGGYWLVDAGIKRDFTAKGWETERWQKVVDLTAGAVVWAQIGAAEHVHPPLRGVVDLRGRTSIRDLVLLTHRAGGVLTPVSLPMHLAAAVPMFGEGVRRRPCVVVAGGREPPSWEAYNEHHYVHTCGMLPCCDNGGCWKARVAPLGDGDDKDRSLCLRTVPSRMTGRPIQKCMDMIEPEAVAALVMQYLEHGRR